MKNLCNPLLWGMVFHSFRPPFKANYDVPVYYYLY